MQNKFFGSKLNSVLLLILIVLMIFALRIMLKDKATYLPFTKIEQIKTPVGDTKYEVSKEEQSVKSNESTEATKNPYIVGKSYQYFDGENYNKDYVFIGYEEKNFSNLKQLPAFNTKLVGESKEKYSKVWLTGEMVLFPTEETSQTNVEKITKSVGGKIIRYPGVTYNEIKSTYYIIKIPEDKNIFDVMNLYKKNSKFRFIEPNVMFESTMLL